MKVLLVGIVGLMIAAGCRAQEAGWFEEPAAPGPSIGLTAESLEAVESYQLDQPVIGTYLFYWYDVYSTAHVTYGDGGDACTTHPPSWEDYSFHSTRWWRQELTDIAAAGIDFAAPVYWGHPDDPDGWSFQGLPHLVRACDYMVRQGETCPKVALFYDTSTLSATHERGQIDLATDDGKAWFYCTVRDFFSYIPPRHWAAVEGRPVILLYAAAFAAKQDPELFPYVRERFQADFGVDPYIIKQSSWQGEADSVCEWGGALGLNMSACAALGPGYDHSAVRGRTPLVKEREGGEFYSRAWETLLRYRPETRPKLVMAETWNEFHEGTDIAHSEEYGRLYIELTRKYADLFHANARGEGPQGAYSDATSLTATFEGTRENGGITVADSGDGLTELAEVGGRQCVRSRPGEEPVRYVYFGVDDSFAFDMEAQAVTIEVDYYDGAAGSFQLHYDSLDAEGSVRDGAFKEVEAVALEETGKWKTASFTLTDARLANRTNGSDFRLAVFTGEELAISGVRVGKGE